MKTNAPNLRFQGFEDEWLSVPLGELYSFKPTNSYSRDMLIYESGTVANIHYGDIHTKFRSHFDITKEQIPFVKTDVSLAKIDEDCYCKVGDIVLADASEDYSDIGKCIELVNLNNQRVLSGLHTILGRQITDRMRLGFAGHLMTTETVRLQIKTIAQGTKVLGISSKRLSQVILSIPSIPEQQKIASFLTSVDDKIQQFSKKKTQLEQYKKGVMQQLFSQQLRFKDDQGNAYPDWEEKRAKDIFKNHTNKNHDGDLPILAITQDQGAVLRDTIGKDIRSSDASVKSYKIVDVGDFIISLRSFQGGIEYSDVRGICSPAYTILKPKIELVTKFFKYYLKKESFIQQLSNSVIGIRDGKQISFDVFSGMKLPFPCLEEQTKIANFLSAIDVKINGVSQQIEHTRQFKKGLLQQMFV